MTPSGNRPRDRLAGRAVPQLRHSFPQFEEHTKRINRAGLRYTADRPENVDVEAEKEVDTD